MVKAQDRDLLQSHNKTNQLTYKSAGEDLVVSCAQLSPEVVGGDSACSSRFLSVVHLSVKMDVDSQKFLQSYVS